MAASDCKTVQKDICDLFAKAMDNEPTQNQLTENNTVKRKEVSGSNATSKKNSKSVVPAELTESDNWLSKLIKRLTVANTIDDMKLVCCDLIAKVAELKKSLQVWPVP